MAEVLTDDLVVGDSIGVGVGSDTVNESAGLNGSGAGEIDLASSSNSGNVTAASTTAPLGPTPVEDDKKGFTPLLPLARVKKIIKSDPDVNMVASDSCLLIAKSTELFLTQLVERSFAYAQREKRRTLQYKDVANAVNISDNLFFLSDVIPAQKTGKQITELLKTKHKQALASATFSSVAKPEDDIDSTGVKEGEEDDEEEIDI